MLHIKGVSYKKFKKKGNKKMKTSLTYTPDEIYYFYTIITKNPETNEEIDCWIAPMLEK